MSIHVEKRRVEIERRNDDEVETRTLPLAWSIVILVIARDATVATHTDCYRQVSLSGIPLNENVVCMLRLCLDCCVM